MGNHGAGRAMGQLADILIERRREGETALELLDLICKPWAGTDAEFESVNPDRPHEVHPDYQDYRDPYAALGKLMCEAFSANGLADLERHQSNDDDDPWGAWYPEVVEPFKQRYGFW